MVEGRIGFSCVREVTVCSFYLRGLMIVEAGLRYRVGRVVKESRGFCGTEIGGINSSD